MPSPPILAHLLQLASAGLLGLFAGAMLTEGFVLVPYWRSLSAEAFFAWYAANDRRLMSFFSPVTAAAAVVTLAASLASVWAGVPGRWAASASAALMLACVAAFFAWFEEANASFSAASVPVAELPKALSRWASWHHARTVVAVVALALMLQALSRPL